MLTVRYISCNAKNEKKTYVTGIIHGHYSYICIVRQSYLIMLIDFTFKNFRSFREEKTLDMEASSITELKDSVIRCGKFALLPAAVIYGANSSGKSNVLMAFAQMRNIVLGSVKLNPGDLLNFDPFVLDLSSPKKSTSFEVHFLQGDTRFRYGFEYNHKEICLEWLYEQHSKEREYNLFFREKNDFSISKTRFPEGLKKESSTPNNRLFLSLTAQLNGEKSMSVMEWFKTCNFLSGLNASGYEGFTLQMFHDHLDGCDEALEFFHHLQLGFKDLVVTDRPIPDNLLTNLTLPNEEIRKKFMEEFIKDKHFVDVKTTHDIYDEQGNVVSEGSFDNMQMESEGTRKVIELSGPLFDTLLNGKILIVDELDAKLHPLLTRSIVRLFMDKETNPRGAQLIFTTHDTNLLNLSFLRRDQIWFTEKDRTASSDLYSLVEFRDEADKKVRKDNSIEKDYINGRYGAIPFFQ